MEGKIGDVGWHLASTFSNSYKDNKKNKIYHVDTLFCASMLTKSPMCISTNIRLYLKLTVASSNIKKKFHINI